MDNILLIFLNELENVDEFNKIIDKFAENNYSIYLLDNIKEDESFSMDLLPGFVDFYKSQHKSVKKVVVLSNASDLILSWYRCFNSLVDDFVYFIDKDDKNYFQPAERHFDFYYKLYKFNGIEKETVNGKISININFNNYHRMIKFLLQENNFKYFNSIDSYYFMGQRKDEKYTSKKYMYNTYEYSFEIDGISNIEKINIQQRKQTDFELSNEFLLEVINNIYIIPYLTVLFYKAKEQNFTNGLVQMFHSLKEVEKFNQKDVFEELFTYIQNDNIDFKEKIYISSLLVMINNGDERLTEFMMKTLLKDKNYMEYHHEILANILFYHSNENLRKHFNHYLDFRNEIGRVSNWASKGLRRDRSGAKVKGKKIAIITDQLVSLNHSPTKLMLDYAKNIRKYYPDYTVKIFVEDTLYSKNELKIIPYLFTSAISSTLANHHIQYLDDPSIEICFSNVDLSKKDRTIEVIKEVQKFEPSFILTNSDISLVSRYYYNKYPIVYMSMGGDYFSNVADAYLCGTKVRVIDSNNTFKLMDNKRIFEFKYGLEFSKPKKEKELKDYNFSSDDFIMVTVGNRLNAELDDEFIDNIIEFILIDKSIKWLIIGPKDIPYIQRKYHFLLGKQIIKVKYESDLSALYKICDVYINPKRNGGGISIAMAMYEKLPIVVFKDKSDGAAFVGYENSSAENVEDYIYELDKLKLNGNYRKYKGNLMYDRVKNFTFENSIKIIFDVVMKLENENKN